MTPTLETLFGGRTAAQVLMFIQAYNEGHANRIATTYEVPVSQVQTQLQKLEANGVLVSRMVGRTRLFTWNPRNPTVQDLQKFLDADPDSSESYRIFQPMKEGELPLSG